MSKTKAEDRTVVLYIKLPRNGDLRLGNNMYRKIDNRTILYRSLENACNHLILSICLLTPFLLCIKGKQLIKRLQESKSKAKLPFFWATASIIHIFNIYMSIKLLRHSNVSLQGTSFLRSTRTAQ